MDQKDKQVETSNRRGSDRLNSHNRIKLTLDSAELVGRSENSSRSGVLFFSDDELRVMVEIEEDGVVKRVPGHVVRVQRIAGQSTGWAVEFDQ